MIAGQFHEGGEGIGNRNVFISRESGIFGYHRIRRSCLKGLGGELIAVEVLALEREEQFAAADAAAVGRHPPSARNKYIVKLFHFFPVLPKPPAPRAVSSRESTLSHSTCS